MLYLPHKIIGWVKGHTRCKVSSSVADRVSIQKHTVWTENSDFIKFIKTSKLILIYTGV